MKTRISVTLSKEVLDTVARMTPKNGRRSKTIERLLQAGLAETTRSARESRDLEVINLNAERLNEEAEDVLAYQANLIISASESPASS